MRQRLLDKAGGDRISARPEEWFVALQDDDTAI